MTGDAATNTDSYTVTVTKPWSVSCQVSDPYGNYQYVYFTLYVENHFSVKAAGGKTQYTVEPGIQISPGVVVTADDTEGMEYVWRDYDGNIIEGANQDTYAFTPARNGWFSCQATDKYGNTDSINFYVQIDNGLRAASADGKTEYGLTYNGSVQLRVSATAKDASDLKYFWNGDISGTAATNTDTYTVKADGPKYVYCEVTDQYGNEADVSFHVYVENHLTAEAADDETNLLVGAGKEASMQVVVTADDMTGLTSQWYDANWNKIDGATQLTCNVKPDRNCSYVCRVEDKYGNLADVWFSITIDNELRLISADNGKTTYAVSPNDTVVLKVTATAKDTSKLTYRWYGSGVSGTAPTDTDSYTVTADGRKYLYCEVHDQYGNYDEVSFDVYIENHLTAEAVGSTYRTLTYGTETELEVTASADDPESIRYQWYGPEFEEDDRPETSKISIKAEKAAEYHCRISDTYGNVETVYFNIGIDNQLQAQALNGQSSFGVAKGTKVTLEVDASAASGELSYRWYGGYIDSDKETGKTLEITVDEYQNYTCKVTDIYGNYVWVYFHVYVENHLVVENADETLELTAVPGEKVTLSVRATADEPDSIRYQWYKSWNLDGMPKTASYTFTAEQAGWYQCKVYDTYGNEGTVYFQVSIDNSFEASAKGNTYITVEPKKPVTMEVTASAASGTIQYQWYDENDDPIDGATASSYTIASAEKSCEFYCRVTDDYGNGSTIWFEIAIENEFSAKAKDGITRIYYLKGGTADLVVEASCKEGSLVYQWYSGEEIEDEDGDTYYSYEELLEETSNTLHLTNVTEEARYRVVVSDTYGNSEEIYFDLHEVAELTVSISGNVTVLPGTETVLAVHAVSDDQTTPITYQWYQRDSEKYTYSLLEGKTEAQLTVKPSESTRYRCRVQQGVQVVRSDVTVNVGTDLWAHAVKELLETSAGKEVTLSVNAETNAASLTYQWYKSEVKDANRLTETGAELTITAEAGTTGYVCVVSDGYETRTVAFTIAADEEIPSPVNKADAIALTEGVAQAVRIPQEEYVWLKFTPNSDGIYQFASEGYADTWGRLDSQNTETFNSDEDEYGNFSFETELAGNTTYYLRVSEESDEAAVCSVIVKRLRATSHLRADAKDSKYEYYVKPNEKVTLEVDAAADTALTYQWSMWDYTTEKEVEVSCTTASYTIETPVTATYYCIVKDTYGNQKSVYFYVYVDTELSAESVDGITTHYVLPGEDLTLAVKAESTEDDPLTYEWVRYDLDTGESTVLQDTDASLSLADIDTSANYRVYVRDAYHNTSSVYYSVILTAKLELEYNGRITVKPGQDAVLSVKAVRSDQTTPVTYQWSVYDDENDVYTDLAGETGSTLTVKEIRKNSLDYRCKATQGTRSRTADFYITVDSGFEMHTDNQTIMGKAGETVSLPVEASTEGGTLVYTWYQDVNGTETLIENESDAQLSVTVPETSAKYICKVADGYASDRVRFSVWNQEVISDGPAPDQAIEIKVDETKYVNISSGGAYLKFVPEQTDTYDFWSVGNEDTWAELLDQDRNQIVYNDDQEDDSNFKLSEELTAGQTYYYHVRYYSKNRTGIIEVKLAENCTHVWDAGIVTKAATCEENGIKTYTCQNNSSHTYTEVIPATGHHLVKTDAKEATCETDGNTEYYTCSNCSKVFADEDGKTMIQLSDTVLKASGHDWSEPVWGEWKEQGDTWTIDVSFTCSRCKEEKKPEVTVEKTKDEAATAESPGETVYTATTVFNGETYTTMKTITTQPIGHNFGGEPTWAWTESGDAYTAVAVFKCTDEGCDRELKIDAVIIVKGKEDPSCEKAGSITYEATVTFDEKTYTAEKVVDVEALGHDWDEGKITTEPTCTDPGAKTYTCKHDNTHTYTESIPAGHTMTKTEAVPATCEKAGNIEYYTCSECKKIFSDEAGTAEVTQEATVIKALGHDWDEGVVTTEPTDTTSGVRTYTCKHDPSHQKTEEIITDAYKQYLADKTQADKVAADLTAIADTIAAAENLSSLTSANASSVTAVKNAYASYSKLSAAQKAILQETQPDLVAQLEKANAKITELEKQQKTEEDTKKQQEETAKKQAEAAAKAAAQAKQAALAKEAAAEEAAGHKTVEATDKAITTMRSDADPSNSVYGTLSARVTKPKKNALKIQWNKVSGAAGYIVYANKCGAGNHYVKIAELNSASAASYNLTKINGKNLTKNTYYKILIAAYKNSSTGKRVIAMARTIHVATSGGKNGNPTKLTLNKKKVSVKVKKKFKLTAKQTGKSGTKIKKHRAVMFESSDPRIATVTKKGVIKGVKKGKCYIYVYAQNGLFKKVKVTVK